LVRVDEDPVPVLAGCRSRTGLFDEGPVLAGCRTGRVLFWPAAAPVLAGYSSRGRPFLANTKLYFELLRTDGVEAAVAAFAA
jgi:hypothetical protein